MTNNDKSPAIRFKGFTDDWEQRRFGDSFKLSQGLQVPIEEQLLIQEENTEQFIRIVDVTQNEEPPRYVYNPTGKGRVSENNIFFVRYGAVGTIGYGYNGVIANNLFKAEPLFDADNSFLYQQFAGTSFNDELRNMSESTSMPAVNFAALNKLVFYNTKYEEQKKIGKYFEDLDNLITLHQRKCDKLIQFKATMLQKMFPQNGANKPEIRFKGFTDAWEQRKWIDTVDISTKMVDPKSGEYDDMPHIAPGNIESFTGRILDNVKTVKEEQLISGKFRFRPNDVVYGKINPQLAKYFYSSVDGLTSADAYVFNSKNGLTQKFLYSILQTKDFFNYSVSVSKRSGMPKINRDELNGYSFMMPIEAEQEQIGNFLLELDTLITLHQHKCDKYKSIKAGLIRKLFPIK